MDLQSIIVYAIGAGVVILLGVRLYRYFARRKYRQPGPCCGCGEDCPKRK